MEATGVGGLMVNSAIANSGLIWADGGNVVIAGAASGGGHAEISGSARMEFLSASDAAVSFDAGAAGTLALDKSSAFSGTIMGFANGDRIDLGDLAFGSGATLGYADDGSGAEGTLQVSDGAVSASLRFAGSYAATDFQLSADAKGNILVNHT